MAKVLMYDIEATNLGADFGYTICIAWKELGKPPKLLTIADYELHDREPWNDSELLKEFSEIWNTADVMVSYYGKGFDFGFLNARLMSNNLPPLSEVTPHVDLYFVVRRVLKLSSRSMGNVGELLELEERKMYAPRKLWVKAQTGHIPSIRELGRRCKSDVVLLEGAYMKLRGTIRLHPNLGSDTLGECRFCGSDHLQRRGYQLTPRKRKQRVQCTECGAWDTRNVEAEE